MRKALFQYPVVSAAAVGLAVVAVMVLTSAGLSTRANASDTTQTAPDWELQDVNGELVRADDFEGNVVLLNFWATWCAPCRIEIPALVELQNEYRQQGLRIVGVSLDQSGADVVKRFVDNMNMNYTVVMGNERIVESYGGIKAIPTTFIIDRNGRIDQRVIGLRHKEFFEDAVTRLLNAEGREKRESEKS